MTKKELIKQLDGIVAKNPKSEWAKYQRHIVNETIKTLTQESVFDKIRAEMKQAIGDNPYKNEGIYCSLHIIDKYKVESEDKE